MAEEREVVERSRIYRHAFFFIAAGVQCWHRKR